MRKCRLNTTSKGSSLEKSVDLILEVQSTSFTDTFTLIIRILCNKQMGDEGQKSAVVFIMTLFPCLLTNSYWLGDFFNKLFI